MTENLEWKEIKNNIKSFRLDEEPEVIHVLKVRENEYIIIHEDAYDLKTGDVEFHDRKSVEEKYNINLKKNFMEQEKESMPEFKHILSQFNAELEYLKENSLEINKKIERLKNFKEPEDDNGEIPNTKLLDDSIIGEFYYHLRELKDINEILSENVKNLNLLVG